MPGSSSSSTSLHLAASPAALGEATGQANSLEMAPRRRTKGEKVGGGDAEEKKVDTLAAVVVAVPSSSSSAPSNNDVAAPIGQRRLDAQRHRHAEVWTKDPHGGRHRPVSDESGVKRRKRGSVVSPLSLRKKKGKRKEKTGRAELKGPRPADPRPDLWRPLTSPSRGLRETSAHGTDDQLRRGRDAGDPDGPDRGETGSG